MARLAQPRSRGFSLLEVLIALAVLALALFALSRSAAVALESAAHREESLLAGMVAANVLAEIRLADEVPATGRREGQQRQGGRDFHWRAVVSPSDLPGIVRIDVAVAVDPQRRDRRASLTGFAGRP
jgi:general secretion pathway protein I